MKFFISYRFTGEDLAKLKPVLESIQTALQAGGHKNYCSFDWQSHFENNDFSNAQILRHSLKELDSADALLAFINSPEKSEGCFWRSAMRSHNGKRYMFSSEKA